MESAPANNLTCAEALERVFEHLDSELSPEHEAELQAHITRCLSCYDRFEFEGLIRARLRTIQQSTPPERLLTKLRDLLLQV